MAETSTTSLETVLADLRSYLTDRLTVLDGELDTARSSVAALHRELGAQEAAVQGLEASRDLLVGKLNELDGAVSTADDVAQARRSRTAAAEELAPEILTAVEADAGIGTVQDAEGTVPVAPAKLNAGQEQVLAFLRANPGVHKVTEIAEGISGSDATSAQTQAVRRALGTLAERGLTDVSRQSGTSFYTAAPAASVAATGSDGSPDATPGGRAPKRTRSRSGSARKAAPKSTTADEKPTRRSRRNTKASQDAATTADAVTPAAEVTPTGRTKRTPSRKSPAKQASTKAAKPATPGTAVRADRTKIVSTLQAAAEPLTAAEVSRTVMGAEWKTSDATNFRNVLKSLTAQGMVSAQLGTDRRARYAAAASPTA